MPDNSEREPKGDHSERNGGNSQSMNVKSVRGAIAAIIILLALGHITGRILSVNSLNTLALEQTIRADLGDELKYLYVLALEQAHETNQDVYSKALLSEFQFDVAKLRDDAAAAQAAKISKEKATRRWPLEARRQNWESRRKDLSTDALIKKVIGETKYRRVDLVAELKFLAVEAAETNNEQDRLIYEQAIPQVLELIAKDQTAAARKRDPQTPSIEVSPFDPKELRDPETVKQIKSAKENRTHHWPVEIRKRDTERMKQLFSEQRLVQMAIDEANKQRPFLSGNDRSRWLTVRSLVEKGTYEINDIIENEPAWDSVDVVSHRNRQGEQKLYSSKPPLHSTIIAVPYWLIHKATGYDLGNHPFEVGRFLLILVNVLPLGLAWYWCAKLLDEWCEESATYVIVLASICFATMLSTFAVALNNHLWGAVSALGATWYSTRCFQGSQRPMDFGWTGFWAAFTFTCELPAASFLAMLGLMLLIKSPKSTLVFGVPAVALVLLAYFGTNYVAHGAWRPPYSYGAGDVNTVQSKTSNNWYDYDSIRWMDGKKVDSYWRNPNNPLDLGEPSTKHYVFHSLVGHHGIFSLTPLLLLAIPGLVAYSIGTNSVKRQWGVVVSVTSLMCLVFYLFLLDIRQRNYGGTTIAFRQLLWLHPIWLLATIPVVDRMIRSGIGRFGLASLAAISVVSVSYPTWNPWSQNWIWNAMVWFGFPPLSQ